MTMYLTGTNNDSVFDWVLTMTVYLTGYYNDGVLDWVLTMTVYLNYDTEMPRNLKINLRERREKE